MILNNKMELPIMHLTHLDPIRFREHLFIFTPHDLVRRRVGVRRALDASGHSRAKVELGRDSQDAGFI